MRKQRFKEPFAKKVFTRFHMILILPTALCHVKTVKKQMMHFIPFKLSLLVFISLLTGCSTVQHGDGGNWVEFSESGQASYYANKHQNRKTASGEIYKHELKTAAHKKIPFGSIVKVTNVKNGKSVIVKINDRGPFVKGRIIDLSKSAFSTIGSISSGLINVKIIVVR